MTTASSSPAENSGAANQSAENSDAAASARPAAANPATASPHHSKARATHPDVVRRAEQLLGYTFTDKGLLETALTHPSAAMRTPTSFNYERLEFLGDSVLGFIVADEIFGRFDDLEEGGLTRVKVSLVSGSSLSRVADALGIGELIIFGESEAGTHGRGLHSALENVYEALVAALYLDGGLDVARAWVLDTLGPHIDRDAAAEPESPKSTLQEHLQAKGKAPAYRIIAESGPPHARTFKAAVSVDGMQLACGEGRSKKAAEAAAAAAAIARLGFMS